MDKSVYILGSIRIHGEIHSLIQYLMIGQLPLSDKGYQIIITTFMGCLSKFSFRIKYSS